jgi:hypothetical protein
LKREKEAVSTFVLIGRFGPSNSCGKKFFPDALDKSNPISFTCRRYIIWRRRRADVVREKPKRRLCFCEQFPPVRGISSLGRILAAAQSRQRLLWLPGLFADVTIGAPFRRQ